MAFEVHFRTGFVWLATADVPCGSVRGVTVSAERGARTGMFVPRSALRALIAILVGHSVPHAHAPRRNGIAFLILRPHAASLCAAPAAIITRSDSPST